MKSLFITALDIGTNSIKAIGAEKDLKTGEIKILAVSQVPCLGVRGGEVVRPEQVALAITEVIGQISQATNRKINEVITAVGGSHIFSMASQGLVSVSRADQHISQEDVQRVLKAAQVVSLPGKNKEVIDVFTQEFLIDGEGGVKNPIGLLGNRLEVKVLLACLFSPVLENLEKALVQADLKPIDVVVGPIASSKAALNYEQKELGVMLLEIGAGATSVAVFEKGDLQDFAVFPVGSANITNDIAIGFRTEIQTAEKLKLDLAVLPGIAVNKVKSLLKNKAKQKADLLEPIANQKPELPETGIPFSQKFLDNIVEARVDEIFSEAQKAMKKYLTNQSLAAGVVLTGGGAKLPGLAEYGRQKFKLPCRLAPSPLSMIPGLNQPPEAINCHEPQWATCLGLLASGFEASDEDVFEAETAYSGGIKGKLKKVMKSFLP
ncbi:MAG: cell division protein FtsA [Candidatus Gribaldobacteria bacterium]|nr:cell division protein FtsA [Candidatus Gribaldobacteria bacterium]